MFSFYQMHAGEEWWAKRGHKTCGEMGPALLFAVSISCARYRAALVPEHEIHPNYGDAGNAETQYRGLGAV
jgi:hypothetical protein